jgi:hypothetical protein
MDVDLREQIAQVLSPDVARQLASTVGMDDRQGKAFVEAAIPALLSAFIASLDSGGARALSDAVSNSDPNALERLSRALAARDLGPLNEGANALGPVLGQGPRDRLANALADYIDTPVEAATPALGAVEQAAVAVIGQQDPSLWSDAGSIAKWLTSQRSAIQAALPPQLAAETARAAPPPPPPPPAPPVQQARPVPPPPPPEARPIPPQPPRASPPPPPPATSSGGSWTWIIILVVVVILAAGGYWYWMQTQAKPAAGFLPPATQFALARSSDLRT